MDNGPVFTMNLQPEGSDIIASVAGDVDISNSVELALRLEAAARNTGGGILTVDLSDLNYMDSSGLRALLRVRNAHPGMRLIVRSGTLVARLINVSGFSDLFEVDLLTAH